MMGCGGCRRRVAPLGTGTQKKEPEKEPEKKVSSQATTAKMRTSFTLLTTSGRTMTFGSQLEALAYRKRNGGTLL